jgi:hypothetical protein
MQPGILLRVIVRHRILHRPVKHIVKLATRMPRAEVGPDALIRHLERDESNVALAHQVHAQHLQAVICRQVSKQPQISDGDVGNTNRDASVGRQSLPKSLHRGPRSSRCVWPGGGD